MAEIFRYAPYGDNGIVVEAGNEISVDTHCKIKGLLNVIEANKELLEGIEEVIPTYTTLLILYYPLITNYTELLNNIMKLEESITTTEKAPMEMVNIPVLYGGEMGPDLLKVAEHNNMSVDEVISIHTSGEYLIYMLGFTPGFPYLGGMSEKISTPRLEVPREKIKAGSVGIAGNQTGIYPIDSPGGWQLIGRTPVKLFDPHRNPAVLLKAGQCIKFEAIDENEFHRIKEAIEKNSYSLKITNKKGSE